jgi:hypothetical protein
MNTRIFLVPLEHNKKEEKLEELLPEVFSNEFKSHRINIYWESIDNSKNSDNLRLRVEDSKLLALFEIILFIIVNRDPRLYHDIYEGTGTVSTEFKDVHISQLARNAAKGSQAVINLNFLFDEIRRNEAKPGVIHKKNLSEAKSEDKSLRLYLKQFNIDELITMRNNDEYLNDYNNKLYKLYYHLLNNLESDNKYKFIDFTKIEDSLYLISKNNNLFDSRFYATDLKEYIKSIRDISDSINISENAIMNNLDYAICCIGSAHVENLRKYLIIRGFKVNIIHFLESLKDLDYAHITEFFKLYIK